MNKLAKIINKLDYEDLIKIKKDLASGNLERLINKRIELIRTTKSKECPVCGGKITNNNYTLTFGPPEIRQIASFDGEDCLTYFLKHRKEKKEKEKEKITTKQ